MENDKSPADGTDVHRKARGAFFTPEPIARFLSNWAIRSANDVVLEPSCGEAAFLLPAVKRLAALGASPASIGKQLHGFDIHGDSIVAARTAISQYASDAQLTEGDFFQQTPRPQFDAVIGNPPYVRYQSFAGEHRTRAREAALRQGVRLTQLASSWAAFTVHASAFLTPGGRLALVLPAELLAVKYAGQIRRFLLERFRTVRLILFEDLVFPGVLEEVVLLLAEGVGGAKSFEVYQAKNTSDLASLCAANWTDFSPAGDEKWTSALVRRDATDIYQELIAAQNFVPLKQWGETYLGAVTGGNEFFTLTRADVSRLKLARSEVLKISPPGSRHLRGLTFSDDAWERMAAEGERCYLFAPPTEPSSAARKYIEVGELAGVHQAYKCTVRSPWWQVPLVTRPQLLFAYMSHDRPRIVRNGARVHLLNSLYGVRLHTKYSQIGAELLPLASLNSVTLLGAELVGRAYGGGMLKHEPREADALPLPSMKAVSKVAAKLRLLAPQIGALLRGNDITPATQIVDGLLLRDHYGLSVGQIDSIRRARASLLRRRLARGRTPNGKN